MKIGIAVSGTGGHIYPAVSLAEFANTQGDEVVFFCNDNETTQNILSKYAFKILILKTAGWQNREIKSLIKALFLFIFAFFKAIFFILKYDIDIVVGFGGYLSVPAGLAAKVLRKKLVIHEQNSYPGLANKILNKFADFTALGFSESSTFFAKKNTVFTGNPVRKEFYSIEPADKKTILVLGGSQGAHGVNQLVGKSLVYLYDQPLHFIHVTGKADKEFVAAYYEESAFADYYEIYDYYENIYELFARSSLIVSRSGASTLAEILTVGLPAILIPYPYATENHQVKNAEVLKALGIAEIFEEKDLDCLRFVKTLKKMLSDDVLKAHVHEVAKKFKNNNFSENLYKLCQLKKS